MVNAILIYYLRDFITRKDNRFYGMKIILILFGYIHIYMVQFLIGRINNKDCYLRLENWVFLRVAIYSMAPVFF